MPKCYVSLHKVTKNIGDISAATHEIVNMK